MHEMYLTDLASVPSEKESWSMLDIFDMKVVVENVYANGSLHAYVLRDGLGQKKMLGGLLDTELEENLILKIAGGWKITVPMYVFKDVGQFRVIKALLYVYKNLDEGDDESLANPPRPKNMLLDYTFGGLLPDGVLTYDFGKGTIKL